MIKNIYNSIVFRRILVIFLVGLVSRVLVNYVLEINVFKEYTNVISLGYYGFMACFSGLVYELPRISFNVLDIKLVRSAIRVVCEGGFLSEDKMLSGDKMYTDNMYTNDNKDLSKDKDGLVCKQDRRSKSGRRFRGERSYADSSRRVDVGDTEEVRRRDRRRSERREYRRAEKAELKRLKENYPRESFSDTESVHGRTTRDSNLGLSNSGVSNTGSSVSNIGVGNNNVNDRNILDKSFFKRVKFRCYWLGWKQFSSDFTSYKGFIESTDRNISVRKDILRDIKGIFKK